ncbi:hypothetical protein Tco_0396914 [Tanacetum coccineum]
MGFSNSDRNDQRLGSPAPFVLNKTHQKSELLKEQKNPVGAILACKDRIFFELRWVGELGDRSILLRSTSIPDFGDFDVQTMPSLNHENGFSPRLRHSSLECALVLAEATKWHAGGRQRFRMGKACWQEEHREAQLRSGDFEKIFHGNFKAKRHGQLIHQPGTIGGLRMSLVLPL